MEAATRANQARRGYVALATAVLGVSCSAILIRLAEAPLMTIAAHRMGVAVLMLAPGAWLYGRRDMAVLGRGDLGAIAASGVFLALHFGLWTVSLGYTSVASSVVFVCMHPIFLALAELIVYKRPTPFLAVVGIGLTMLGSLVIAGGDVQLGVDALFGDLLAGGGAVAMVGYLMIGQRLRRRLSFITYSTLVYAVCWLVLSAAALLGGSSLLQFGARDLLLVVALAAGSTIGGHTIFNWALRHIRATLVGVVIVAEPLGAALLAWLILGEPIPLWTALGGGVILLGIYCTARGV